MSIHDLQHPVVLEVLEAEERRLRALRERDWDTLADLFDDELTYTHLSGHTESKVTSLEWVKTREHNITRSNLEVRVYGDVAVMTGGITMGLQSDGPNATPPLQGVALQVWVHRDSSWRLVAFQATRVNPPQS